MHVFWKNVRSIIDYREISLKMLAILSDVPYSTITNGKNKKRQPSVETAYKIASALNEPLESLICDTAQLRTESIVLKLKNSFRKNDVALCRKYGSLLVSLEKLPVGTQESIINFIFTVAGKNLKPKSGSKKEHTEYDIEESDD